MSGESTEAPKLLELSWELDRESVIYAKDHFTVYITINNKSLKRVTIWAFGIMGSSEFYLQTFYQKTGYVEGTTETMGKKITRFISSILSFGPGILEEYEKDKPPEKEPLSDVEKRNKARKDIFREHYYDRLQKKGAKYLPWQLSSEESLTVNFEVETKHSILFVPGKYKLNLFVDYSTIEKDDFFFCWDNISEKASEEKEIFKELLRKKISIDWIKDVDIEKVDNGMEIRANKGSNSFSLRLNDTKSKVNLKIDTVDKGQFIAIDEKGKLNIYGINEEFARITKLETVDVLASPFALMWGGILGAIGGATSRILIKSLDENLLHLILSRTFIAEIIVSIILSILVVTALARRTGSQTIITIQDFWGGLFIGFMAGYAGHDYVDKLIGIGPGEILTNQTENVTNQISNLTDQTNNLTNQIGNLTNQISNLNKSN